jgi:hypothetical protein
MLPTVARVKDGNTVGFIMIKRVFCKLTYVRLVEPSWAHRLLTIDFAWIVDAAAVVGEQPHDAIDWRLR